MKMQSDFEVRMFEVRSRAHGRAWAGLGMKPWSGGTRSLHEGRRVQRPHLSKMCSLDPWMLRECYRATHTRSRSKGTSRGTDG